MRSAVLCYAAADADFAHDIAAYLELNCALVVSLTEGRMEARSDIVDVAGRALSADHPILLLSPDSIPTRWDRARWEPVLFDEARELGRQVAYVLVRPCEFPKLFRLWPRIFFDLSEQRLPGLRALRRWLLEQDPFFQNATNLDELAEPTSRAHASFDELEDHVLDRPGVQADVDRNRALAFAHTHTADFEGVFWINCANRSRAGIAGDIAHALGLSLRGPLEENVGRLREFCASRRLLLVFEHLRPSDRDWVAFGGKDSVLFVADRGCPPKRSLEETAVLFSNWRNSPEACLRALGDAQSHLHGAAGYSGEDRRTAVSLGLLMSQFLEQMGRLAELYEVLELMSDAARKCGDPLQAHQYEWEKSWIREAWGHPIPSRVRPISSDHATQLTLQFDAD